jgi:hypothetical protein
MILKTDTIKKSVKIPLKIAARRGGGERQMHRQTFDRAFRAS